MITDIIKKALEKKESYYHHHLYKAIPNKFLNDKILELGSGNGITQLCSKHAERFLSKDYLGIDFLVDKTYLNIFNIDVFDFDFSSYSYNSLLAVAIFEHIDFYLWDRLFKTCLTNLNEKGYIIIIVPFKEKVEVFYSSTYPKTIQQMKENNFYSGHRVFYITKKVFKLMLGKPVYIKRVRQRIHFKEKEEKMLWAILRFIKRLITFHPYVWNYFLGKDSCLLFIYQKNEEKK